MNTRISTTRRMILRSALALPLLTGAASLTVRSAEPMTGTLQDPVRTADVMPTYPGGNEALAKYMEAQLTYPAGAKAAGIEGTVYVHFVVNADGSIRDVKAPRPVNPELEAEAMRVVSAMPAWTPGKQGGTVIPVLMTLPVSFKLSGK